MQNTQGKGSSRRVFVGVFGKHPGWNDHVDDIGLETDRLVAFKRLLYIEGIAGNVDAGTWERLGPDQKLDGFGSVFLSLADGAPVMGRMWASQDGKGRGRYPMVVCVQAAGQTLGWLLEQAFPRLAAVEATCKAAKTAGEVGAAVAAMRAALESAVAAGGVARPAVPVEPGPASAAWPRGSPERALADLSQALEPMQNGTGFARALYKVERDLTAFLRTAGKGGSRQAQPQHIRIPSVADSPDGDLLAWTAALLCLLDPATPLFLNRPVRETWVDIVAGPPKAQHFYCLLASRQAIPFATDVPYTMDASFLERAKQLAAAWRSGSHEVRTFIAQADGSAGAGRSAGWLGLIRGVFRSGR
jgi:hypothetical protein